MKCKKCIGRGYWNVFSGTAVNGAKEENELIKQTCDKCNGTGTEEMNTFVIRTAEDLAREIRNIKAANLPLSEENRLIINRTVFLYKMDKYEYLRYNKKYN